MPPRTPSVSSAPSGRAWFQRPWLWAVLAFFTGLLLFALVLMRDGREDFFRADDTAPAAAAPDYTPLPAPLPADGTDTVRLPRAPDAGGATGDEPRLVETAPPPPPTVPRPVRAPAPTAGRADPEPIPGQSPAPRYPVRALRRGEEGVVNVRAQIGPDGVPTSVSIVSGSGSRDLDRAALDAVRRWRFRPAFADGRPTVGTVVVPIAFERD